MEVDIHLKIRCALQKNTNSILIFPSAVAHLYTIKLKAAGNHDFENKKFFNSKCAFGD